jgi:hypothetical protein
MGETQSGLLQFNILEFLVFQEAQEVVADSTDQLADHGGGGGLDLQGVVEGAC